MRWAVALGVAVVLASSAPAQAPRVPLTHPRRPPPAGDARITGLSGITCVGPVEYYGVSDHPAQVVLLGIELRADASMVQAIVPAIHALPAQQDTEGIALDRASGKLIVADESPGISEY